MANPEELMHLLEVGVLTLGCDSRVSFGFGIGRYREMLFPFSLSVLAHSWKWGCRQAGSFEGVRVGVDEWIELQGWLRWSA